MGIPVFRSISGPDSEAESGGIEMRQPSAVHIFAAALRDLRAAAGEPTYGELIRQSMAQKPPVRLTSSTLSEWFNGRSVPTDPRALQFLVVYLDRKAKAAAQQSGPVHRAPDLAKWEHLRQQAWREKHVQRGGRPPTPATTGPSTVAASRDSTAEATAEQATRGYGDLQLITVAACRPEWVGVHSSGPRAGGSTGSGDMPAYIRRDHDQALRDRLRAGSAAGGFVLLVGGSSTGKTWSLFEAIREVLPGWLLFLPPDASGLRAAKDALPGQTVVWLDDTPTERYIAEVGQDGLTRQDILQLLHGDIARPIIVVDTMWPGRYQALTSMPADDRGDPYHDPRQVLALAGEPVEVPEQWSQAERDRAVAPAAVDTRLADALRDTQFGVTQFLAGAPELIRTWRHADHYARAIITVGMDARRLGFYAPLTISFLQQAAAGYLTDRQRASASPDWLADALRVASRVGKGTAACLLPVAGHPDTVGEAAGYTVADYLIQYGQRQRTLELTHPSLWDALVRHAQNEADLSRLAFSADQRKLYRYADPLYRRAVAAGASDSNLINLLGEECKVDDLRNLAAGGSWYARQTLASSLAELGRADEAIKEQRTLVASSAPYARNGLLRMLAMLGRKDELILELRELLAPTDPGSPDSADMRKKLVDLLIEQGRKDEAIDELRPLAGNDHDAHWRLLGLLFEQEREDELRTLAVAGRHNACTFLARLLVKKGRKDEAISELSRLAAAGVPGARSALAELPKDPGRDVYRHGTQLQREPVREDELRKQAEAGDQSAAERLVNLLVSQRREEELWALADAGSSISISQETRIHLLFRHRRIDELRELADAGNMRARESLIDVLIEQGRDSEAIAELRKPGRGGFRGHKLPELLAKRGEEAELRALAKTGDAADHHWAHYWLVHLLTEQGGEADLRALAATGDDRAHDGLINLLVKQDRLGEAIDELRLRAHRPPYGPARDRFIELLARQGRTDELRALDRIGFAPSKSLAEQGRTDALRTLVAAGDYEASWHLANLLSERGQEHDLRILAAAGVGNAALALRRLLAAPGREHDAHVFKRLGLNPDGSPPR